MSFGHRCQGAIHIHMAATLLCLMRSQGEVSWVSMLAVCWLMWYIIEAIRAGWWKTTCYSGTIKMETNLCVIKGGLSRDIFVETPGLRHVNFQGSQATSRGSLHGSTLQIPQFLCAQSGLNLTFWYYLSCRTGGYPSPPVPNNAIPVHARFEKKSLFHCIWISNLYLSYRTTQIGVWPVRTSTFWPFYLSRTVGQSLRSSPANGSSVKIGQGSHWYNTGQYHMTLSIAPLQWLKQIINQCINSNNTP